MSGHQTTCIMPEKFSRQNPVFRDNSLQTTINLVTQRIRHRQQSAENHQAHFTNAACFVGFHRPVRAAGDQWAAGWGAPNLETVEV